MYLVDTDVISEGALSKEPSAILVAWMDHTEIADGIAKMYREGASRKATQLEERLDTLLHLYDNRVLPFDVPSARIAGKLSDRARSKGHILLTLIHNPEELADGAVRARNIQR